MSALEKRAEAREDRSSQRKRHLVTMSSREAIVLESESEEVEVEVIELSGDSEEEKRRAEDEALAWRLHFEELEGEEEAWRLQLAGVQGPAARRRGSGLLRRLFFRNAQRDREPEMEEMGYEEMLEIAERIGEVKNRGASRREIDRLPTERVGKAGGGSCSICLENIRSGNSMRRLPCFHAFHVKCIDSWLIQNKICPVCRVAIDANHSLS